MTELFYVLAFLLMGVGVSVSQKLNHGSIVYRPTNRILLRVITDISALSGLTWFAYGFFPFSWWLPLISIALYAICGAYLIQIFLKSYFAPLIAITASVTGMLIAVTVLIYT